MVLKGTKKRGSSGFPAEPQLIPAITYSRGGCHYHRPRMLNGRVRNGNGCDHPGMLTEKLLELSAISVQPSAREFPKVLSG